MARKKIDGRADNGGVRNGAGRKADPDKKIGFLLYFRPSEIKKIGGSKNIKKATKDAKYIMYSKWEEELGLPHGRDYNNGDE